MSHQEDQLEEQQKRYMDIRFNKWLIDADIDDLDDVAIFYSRKAFEAGYNLATEHAW